MDFIIGDSGAKQTDTNDLPRIVREAIRICKKLPDQKLLFSEDMSKRVGCNYLSLKNVAPLMPPQYSAVGPVEVSNSYDSNTTVRKKRVYGNEKTIKAWLEWLNQKKKK